MHSFSITVQVNDPRALFAAALADYLADNNQCEGAHADALGILGDESAPNINACLLQLLDPRELAGCEIQDSGAAEHGATITHEGEEMSITTAQASALLAAHLIHEFDDDLTPNLYFLGSVGDKSTTLADIKAHLSAHP